MRSTSSLLAPALAAVLPCALAVAACSGSTTTRGFDDGTSTSSSSSSGGSSGASSGGFGTSGSSGGSTSGSSGSSTCAAATTFVYVVSDSNVLYQFVPNTGVFTRIGTLSCPAGAATPNSMAVDRKGVAWVNFSDGSLFNVSTTDASCKPTTFQPLQHGFERFGMAFASNSAGSEDETLYVVGISGLDEGQGLAKIDLSTMVLTPIGDFSGSLRGRGAELTGTGDGRLFGFFTTSPYATLAQIDTKTGATSGATELDGVSTGAAWAFSFWGGDFWFYTSDGFSPSIVTRKASSSDGALSTPIDDVGNFRIVGAGVSTCAPTSPPK
ncbi:MAG: hypothetical protein JWP97_5287 [Labilithrix sp.]|nr:hypothetical protein [Labilithrix sp.]